MMKNQFGYTLIEILVALFIFAILSVVVLTGLTSVFSTAQGNKAHARDLGKLQMALTLIERDIGQMIERPITDELGRRGEALEEYALDGKQYVEFTRAGYVNPQAQENRSTLQRVSYQLEKDQLIKRHWTVLDRIADNQSAKRIVLTGVNSIQWRFLDWGNKYHTIWPPISSLTRTLPKAIELKLSLENHGEIIRLLAIPKTKKNENYQNKEESLAEELEELENELDENFEDEDFEEEDDTEDL